MQPNFKILVVAMLAALPAPAQSDPVLSFGLARGGAATATGFKPRQPFGLRSFSRITFIGPALAGRMSPAQPRTRPGNPNEIVARTQSGQHAVPAYIRLEVYFAF
jgi:hypothetical protein